MAVIRLADPKRDARQVAAIYYPYVINTPITFESEPPDGNEMSSRMENVLTSYPWLVCVHDDEVMGYAYGSQFRTREAYDWSVETTVYVREAAHGMGIGSAIYTGLLECLRLQGFVSAVGVIALPNHKSVMLHEKLGFREDGILPSAGYKNGTWYDVGLWWKKLHNPPAHPETPLKISDLVQNNGDNLIMALSKGEVKLRI
ncbi:MAG: GNAT family N-acetyltransferase [Chloroflexi bacterium]|nr:GNAT family N-acetyltransferase [Chloroflexota bacterium]|tara:strand:- start:735 stop:1337 length:603 start_codon:yes stop_codon:yes gene_type:complete